MHDDLLKKVAEETGVDPAVLKAIQDSEAAPPPNWLDRFTGAVTNILHKDMLKAVMGMSYAEALAASKRPPLFKYDIKPGTSVRFKALPYPTRQAICIGRTRSGLVYCVTKQFYDHDYEYHPELDKTLISSDKLRDRVSAPGELFDDSIKYLYPHEVKLLDTSPVKPLPNKGPNSQRKKKGKPSNV